MQSTDTSNALQERVNQIREKMAAAARQAGRLPADILLCAACKSQSSHLVRLAADSAVDVFGESRMQEMRTHLRDAAFAGKPCHFIGQLQTNKVRQVVGQADLIHSVGSPRLLAAIAAEADRQGITQAVLIQINLGQEASKTGISEESLRTLLEQAAASPGVLVRGLMAIPPPTDSPAQARPYFAQLRELMNRADSWGIENTKLNILSMGMSDSYEAAILEGATLVRIGRQIFGERP